MLPVDTCLESDFPIPNGVGDIMTTLVCGNIMLVRFPVPRSSDLRVSSFCLACGFARGRELLATMERQVTIQGAPYRLVRLSGDDIARLVPLLHATFPRRNFTADWLNKKYSCESHGLRGFSCVAVAADGTIIATLGVLPWPIRFESRTELAAQVVDAATDYAHRRRGLLTHLGVMVQQAVDAQGVSFLFGFAQTQAGSYPALTRNLGFRHIDDLVEYRLPIRTFPTERLARRVIFLQRFNNRRLERALTAYRAANPVLENSLLGEGFAGTHRDAAFFEYKSFSGDNRVLELEGRRVWLKIQRGFMIGDVEASTEQEIDRSIRGLKGLAAQLGVHQIVFQSSGATHLSGFLASRFRALPGLTVLYRNLRSEIPVERLRFTLGDLDNF